jgi:phosphoglycolate phosphatase
MHKNFPEVYIFDLDGTLIDSAIVIAEILNEIRSEKGMNPIDVFIYKYWVSLGARELILKSLEISEDHIENSLIDFRKRYQKIITPKSVIYPGVEDTIKNLISRKKLIAICSNKPESLCRKVLKDIELFDFFSVIVGGDSLKKSKPHPDPLIYILKKLSKPKQSAVFIGDSSIDIKASKAASIPFIFHLNGYNDGVKKKQANFLIENISDLLTLDFC